MMKPIAYIAALTVALSSFMVAAAPSAADTVPAAAATAASPLVLVPFEEPGSKDSHLPDATAALMKELQSHGVAFVMAPVQAHADVATSAATLCTTYKGTGILVGSYHADQTNRLNAAAMLVPFWAIAAGAFKEAPTHTTVKLDELDCTGTTTKHFQGEGNEKHHGNNADASVTNTIALAMHQAVDRMTGVVTPDATVSPTPAPSANP